MSLLVLRDGLFRARLLLAAFVTRLPNRFGRLERVLVSLGSAVRLDI
jgi:hypothetical protein